MTITMNRTRRFAARIAHFAGRLLVPVRSELAAAMMTEIEFVEGDLPALRWSIGCLSFACVERARWQYPMLFRVGTSAPRTLWHITLMLGCGWLGALSLFGLVGKMLHPGQVGLWVDLPLNAPHRYESVSGGLLPVRVGHDHVVFGLPYDGTTATEMLGPWFVLLMGGLLLFALWAGHRSLSAALRAARIGPGLAG